jgi:hypothetical protein
MASDCRCRRGHSSRGGSLVLCRLHHRKLDKQRIGLVEQDVTRLVDQLLNASRGHIASG